MISLCMIVKDEIEVLERCINSISEKMGKVVDEYIVVDTGSTDGTRELAEKLNCKVYDFEWCNDFSKARNFSTSKAKNDWVFIIDADEYVISEFSKAKMKKICTKEYKDYAFTVNIQNLSVDNLVASTAVVARLYNRKVYEFRHVVHEQLRRLDNKATVFINSQVILKHTGYLPEVIDGKDKIRKYEELLKNELKKDPNSPYMLSQLGAIYYIAGDYDKAMEYLEKVVFNEKCVRAEYYSAMVIKYLQCLISIDAYEAGLILENVWEYCVHDTGYVHLMAKIYFETKHYEKCVDALLICVNSQGLSNSDKIYSYYILGSIFEFFGENEDALKCYIACGSFNDAEEKVKLIKEKIESN